MRSKLYEKLKNKKELLKTQVEVSFVDEDIEKQVKQMWVDYTPSYRNNFAAAVSDGSLRIRQYLGFYLIVFSGYGYFYNLQSKQNSEWDAGDIIISVVKRPELAKSYGSLLMFLSELKTIYKLAKEKKPNIVIFDGTITSRLITPFPRAEWFTKSSEFEEITNTASLKIIDKMKDKFLLFDDIFSLSTEVEKIVINILTDMGLKPRQDIKEAIIAKLAYYEMMVILTDFLKNSSFTIVGVAKTSSGTDIFKESLPDIKLFSKYTHTLGYSAENIPQDIQQLKSSFGEVLGDISILLSELDIQAFYAKYSTPNVVNLIEFYQNPDRASVDVRDILDMLSSISVDGYPFLLKKVDNEVRITQTDMDFIQKELGLERGITGRENL